MPPRFQPAVAQHIELSSPELGITLEKAKVNDRSVEGLVQRVKGVNDGGMLDMLRNSVNNCHFISVSQLTYL